MTEDGEDSPFICSAARENGMLRCRDVPAYAEGGAECFGTVGEASVNSCVNWNQYYNVCRPGDYNPHKGAVNFDNIGYAWIAIFQVRMDYITTKHLSSVSFCSILFRVMDGAGGYQQFSG